MKGLLSRLFFPKKPEKASKKLPDDDEDEDDEPERKIVYPEVLLDDHYHQVTKDEIDLILGKTVTLWFIDGPREGKMKASYCLSIDGYSFIWRADESTIGQTWKFVPKGLEMNLNISEELRKGARLYKKSDNEYIVDHNHSIGSMFHTPGGILGDYGEVKEYLEQEAFDFSEK